MRPMDGLHVRRFRAHHQVAGEEGRLRARAAQQALIDGELEGAIAAGLATSLTNALGTGAGSEIVLLRRLSARVKLQARHSDHDNARAWGDALALGLQQALQHGNSTDLLRYAHRGQALAAFVEDAVRAVDVRDWAWQRLGLLPPTPERRNSPAQRRHALLRCLADDIQHSVPLLRRLHGGAVWTTLLKDLHDVELRGLVQATLAHLAGHGAAPFTALLAGPGTDRALSLRPAAGAATAATTATEVATLTPVTAAAHAAGTPARALWALRLTAMLLHPALARRGATAVDGLVASWTLAPRPTTSPAAEASDAALQPGTVAAVMKAGRDAGQRTRRGPGDAGLPTAAAGQVAAPASGPSDRSANRVQAVTARGPDSGRRASSDEGFTTHGGLLLLTPLLPVCGALALLEDAAIWPADSLPQALHCLALQLTPLRADDPAALAFCGLTPRSPPPQPLQADAAQDAALQAAQDLLMAALHERLPDWRGPALLQRVVTRSARIVADPGWIEVRFPLREVAVELRRAALDLDPGFVPWLGVVLSLRYE